MNSSLNTGSMNTQSFKKILYRNVALPLAMSALLCAAFVGLLFNMISVSRQVSHSNLVSSETNELLNVMLDAEAGLRGYLLYGRLEFLGPYQTALGDLDPQVRALEQASAANPVRLNRIQEAVSHFKEWDRYASADIQRKKKGIAGTIDDATFRKAKMDQIRAIFGSIMKTEDQNREALTAQAASRSRQILILIVLLSAVVGGVIAWLGRKQLLSLSTSYESTLDKQRVQNEQLTQQAWVRTGQTELGERMRGDLSGGELGEKILAFLAQYVGASVGAIYQLRDNGFFERIASYAFSDPENAPSPDKIRPGEGLVGQVGKEGRLLVLDPVPAEYLRVSSALGSTSPASVALVPLVADGAVQGVLELGFLGSLGTQASELLKASSEMVGVALRSAAYRTRLQFLLHQSQQLTEELQTQQEELRVSNEELSERSKALQEAQARLEGQHAELEQTNEQLEQQARVLEQQKRDLDLRNHDLETAQREIEAASRYKSEFLANMSHELRTPLNSSLILAKLLKDNPEGNLTPEQVEFASTIYSAGNDLLNLINDILDLSKVEAGKLEVQPEPVPLAKLVESLERIFQPLASERKLELNFILDPDCPKTILTDRQRLEQILRNLLSNALKFTQKGSVSLQIRPDSDNRVSFVVKDTGIGIAASQHQTIFDAFRQADGTTKRKYGGTGLGLSISRNLAQLLGGNIHVESEPNKGSTFVVTIPMTLRKEEQEKETRSSVPNRVSAEIRSPSTTRSATAPHARPERLFFEDDRDRIKESGAAGRTLLIVEDEPRFARILFDLAHERGYACLVTDNTADGFELATGFRPSAIILDMKLPDASGLSLLDRLKADPKTRHIPVHGVSAADFSREALHLGAVGYALKPTDHRDLEKTFARLEEKIAQRTRRVLVVEDDEVQRTAIQKLIGEQGVEIVTVGLAKEGLKKLKDISFDCVIIDLSLPDMSGFDMLERMVEESSGSLPPVIVYTGRSLDRNEEDRLGRYSRSIIIKGARSPERLLDEVTLFLHQAESQLSPERQKLLKVSRNREKAFEGRKILLADDDVRNIFALTSALEQKGAQVKIARNGREAIERLSEESGIDLVLMDIMMPEMDGYQAMREIRKKPGLSEIPIIAVTAKAMKDDYDKCLEAGANDYLPKPIDVEKLVSLMRVWLPRQVGRA